jgi:hypothetical protein
LKSVKQFAIDSYRSDPVAFYLELVAFVSTVGASMWLAVSAANPDMTIIYPGFFVGAVTGALGYYRRRILFPMLLTTYFALVNIFGYGVASEWW